MPTDVVMPQMGESIAEGTVVRWIKQVGDQVDRDEPLFEISTDKVDAEIPSPASGVLTEIRVAVGQTVPINAVVAVIGGVESVGQGPGAPSDPIERTPAESQPDPPPATPGAVPSQESRRRQRSSPLVRRIAREHGIDISQIRGSGLSGRVTKADVLGFLERRKGPAPAESKTPEPPSRAAATEAPGFEAGASTAVVPMSVMRRKIAEHMVQSRRTSAHVHSVFEVDFSHVIRLRAAATEKYARAGVKLSYLAFIAKATVDALHAMPVLNASIDGDNVVYRREIHLGIAVALEGGLIVPVIRRADERNLLGLSRAIGDLAERARAKQLSPDEVQGGTFTVTNPGGFGAVFGMPIINQPQVGILGVGSIEKRPVVVGDAIAIRQMAYLTLGFDHRLIDGAVADAFMAHVKRTIEQFDESQV